MAKAKNDAVLLELKPIDIREMIVRVRGDTSLIVHAWSEKAKRMILEKQMRVTTGKARDAKDPVEDFIDSLYWITPKPEERTQEGYEAAIAAGARFGFPAVAFKQAAILGVGRGTKEIKMTEMRAAFFVLADQDDMVEIKGDAPIIREDMVKIAMGGTDIRYRGEMRNWYADLRVQYDASGLLTPEQIINAINRGGFSIGVGEWRPEKDGNNGRFHVEAT